MSRYEEVEDYIVTSDANSTKNLSSDTFPFSSAAVTVPTHTYVLRSYTIPLSESTRFYQLLVNLSIDGNQYFSVPTRDRRYNSGNRTIATVISVSGSDITLNLYLIATSGSSQNFPAFTINVIRRDIVDEVSP